MCARSKKIHLLIALIAIIFAFLADFAVFAQEIPYKCVRKYDVRYGYVPCDFEGPSREDGYFDPFQWLGITPEGFMVTIVVSIVIAIVIGTVVNVIYKIKYRHLFAPPPPPPSPQSPQPPRPVPRMPSQVAPTKIRPKRGPIFGPRGKQGRGKAKWTQSPPYPQYETPPPSDMHEVSPSPIEAGGLATGGAGISYYRHAYPPVENLKITGHGNTMRLRWDSPPNDPAKGELIGYDVYRYEDVPSGTGKEYRSLATLPPGVTGFSAQHKKGSENYGVNPIYRTDPDGRIIIGHVPE